MDDQLSTSDLPQRLCAAWPPQQWRDVHVLAAVSAGADSMALLAAFLDRKAATAARGKSSLAM